MEIHRLCVGKGIRKKVLINEYNHKHWAETIGSFLKVGSEYSFHT